MKKSKRPAGSQSGAWRTGNQKTVARHFGSVPVDRLYLGERSFGPVGKLKIYTDFFWDNIENYQRCLDEKTGILSVSFIWEGHPIEIMTFASGKEELLYYEISADCPCLNLRVVFEPTEKAYRNYNLGGFYFETQKKRSVLIGKGELKADGFPKADEAGIHVKNASRVSFRIYLKSDRLLQGVKPSVRAMELQMAMNRYLAKTDDISRDGLIRLQGKKDV